VWILHSKIRGTDCDLERRVRVTENRLESSAATWSVPSNLMFIGLGFAGLAGYAQLGWIGHCRHS
jgi:hypothetical protein